MSSVKKATKSEKKTAPVKKTELSVKDRIAKLSDKKNRVLLLLIDRTCRSKVIEAKNIARAKKLFEKREELYLEIEKEELAKKELEKSVSNSTKGLKDEHDQEKVRKIEKLINSKAFGCQTKAVADICSYLLGTKINVNKDVLLDTNRYGSDDSDDSRVYELNRKIRGIQYDKTLVGSVFVVDEDSEDSLTNEGSLEMTKGTYMVFADYGDYDSFYYMNRAGICFYDMDPSAAFFRFAEDEEILKFVESTDFDDDIYLF